jgi:hypothetical protein
VLVWAEHLSSSGFFVDFSRALKGLVDWVSGERRLLIERRGAVDNTHRVCYFLKP